MAPVVAEDVQGGRVEQEVAPVVRGQPDPAGDEHAEDVAVGEERDGAPGGLHPADHAVHARADLVGAFRRRDSRR